MDTRTTSTRMHTTDNELDDEMNQESTNPYLAQFSFPIRYCSVCGGTWDGLPADSSTGICDGGMIGLCRRNGVHVNATSTSTPLKESRCHICDGDCKETGCYIGAQKNTEKSIRKMEKQLISLAMSTGEIANTGIQEDAEKLIRAMERQLISLAMSTEKIVNALHFDFSKKPSNITTKKNWHQVSKKQTYADWNIRIFATDENITAHTQYVVHLKHKHTKVKQWYYPKNRGFLSVEEAYAAAVLCIAHKHNYTVFYLDDCDLLDEYESN